MVFLLGLQVFGTKVTKIWVGLGLGLGSGITKSGFSPSGFQIPDYITIKGKDVLIIGTQIPWIEMIAVLNDAKSVTTMEYNVITTDHPGLILMTNVEFIEKYLSGELSNI